MILKPIHKPKVFPKSQMYSMIWKEVAEGYPVQVGGCSTYGTGVTLCINCSAPSIGVHFQDTQISSAKHSDITL